MPNYQNGLIYKIVCKDLDVKYIYVGSTCNFETRRNNHKSKCNNGNNYKIYQIIRANGGWDNWKMIEVEKYPCNDGNELRARERIKYEELKGNMNIHVPNRCEKERMKEYNKEYYKNNKEILKEKRKKYRENNKEKIKEYRENNKEKINKKINCVCGSLFMKKHKKRHERSKKHQKYINHLKPPLTLIIWKIK